MVYWNEHEDAAGKDQLGAVFACAVSNISKMDLKEKPNDEIEEFLEQSASQSLDAASGVKWF